MKKKFLDSNWRALKATLKPARGSAAKATPSIFSKPVLKKLEPTMAKAKESDPKEVKAKEPQIEGLTR